MSLDVEDGGVDVALCGFTLMLLPAPYRSGRSTTRKRRRARRIGAVMLGTGPNGASSWRALTRRRGRRHPADWLRASSAISAADPQSSSLPWAEADAKASSVSMARQMAKVAS